MGAPVFEIYNADGSLKINLASRLTKVLGTIAIGTSAGSYVDPEIKNGTPWFTVLTGFDPGPARPAYTAKVSMDRNSGLISWTTGTGAGWITYGVYSNGAN